MRKSIISTAVGMTFAAALAASAATAWAQDTNDMMGGNRPTCGMMGGGQGGMDMMGGGQGGMGMMGGGQGGMGMGSGMMGGYGPGDGLGSMGMMGGMMGIGALENLDLSSEQRTKIRKILDDERKQQWPVMGKVMDQQDKLRDLYDSDQPDPKMVGAVYGAIAKLRQQMIETHVQASNQVQQILTKEQREQWRQGNRGGRGGGPRGPAAGRPGTMGPGMMQ